MPSYLDMNLLKAYLKARRADFGLRDAAAQIGEISPATLSRIENGKVPDMEVFLRLCDWMGLPPDMFLKNDEEAVSKASTAEIIEAHLRADPDLDDETAEAISKIVRSVYALKRRESGSKE